jgi:hypothetical protein
MPIPVLLLFLSFLFPALGVAQKTALDLAQEVVGKWEDGTGSVLEFSIAIYSENDDYCVLKVERFETMHWSSTEKKLVKKVIQPSYFNSLHNTVIGFSSVKPVLASRNVISGPKDPVTGKKPTKTIYTFGHEQTADDPRPCVKITTHEMQELQWIFDYSNGKLLGFLKGAPDYENPGGTFRRTRKDGQTNTERETAFRLV